MSLSTISIKRPVLTIVMNLIIILFGIIGYTYLCVREFPSIDPAVISVQTNYAGANADIIESQITNLLKKLLIPLMVLEIFHQLVAQGRSSTLSNLI